MMAKLKRVVGQAELRTLTLLVVLASLAFLGIAAAQFAASDNDVQTVETWDDLIKRYLLFREQSYKLVAPSLYQAADQVEGLMEQYGPATFQEQPDWFMTFDMGTLYFPPKSELAQQLKHGTRLVIYEDITQEELVIVNVDGEESKEEIVFKALPWPDIAKTDTPARYLARELSKRRIVWQVTLKDRDEAAAEAAALAAQQKGAGGSEMLMLMGGEGDLGIVQMARATNGLRLEIGYPAEYSGTIWSAYSYDAPACAFTNLGGGGGGNPPPPDTNDPPVECTNCILDCGIDPTNAFDGLGHIWTLVASNIVLTGETQTAWIDTRTLGFDANTNPVNRSYAFGNNGIDTDSDGLNDAFEQFTTKTDPSAWDTDGDGVSDGAEASNGTNPNNPNDPPNVTGTISYYGQQTNVIRVLAVTDSNSWSLTHSTALAAPGVFQIANLPGTSYWLKAYRDLDGDGTLDAIEASGVHSNSPIVITNQVAAIAITLIEPDTDGDGLTDYEELYLTGTSPTNNADGLALVEDARSTLLAHWTAVLGSLPAFTNAPASQADLNDIYAALQTLATNFFLGGPETVP